MSLDIPFDRTISHYRILSQLGGGGMGVVYEAEDLKLHRHVPISVFSTLFLSRSVPLSVPF
jgi:serine/threonine protein kinase